MTKRLANGTLGDCICGGRLVPMRYGISSDVQLWSTTDLAVEFLLSRLGR